MKIYIVVFEEYAHGSKILKTQRYFLIKAKPSNSATLSMLNLVIGGKITNITSSKRCQSLSEKVHA
ncbi:MAG TPA: hypothetical protein VFD60_09265 [Nitrososphaeraceae archaeon]|jgi:hypothetical protein|nr:hypothetical protein [Nitrososphaeraceae archaeon]